MNIIYLPPNFALLQQFSHKTKQRIVTLIATDRLAEATFQLNLLDYAQKNTYFLDS